MPDSTSPPPLDLSSLAADYDIVGELGSRSATSRMLIGTRKARAGQRSDDDPRVLIEIVREPDGDEANALQHLASDVKTLSGLRHRRLVQTIEGRWIGNDAFAVVRSRVDDPTVAERLAQGETFTNTRTAAILREVHGLLEWAREQQLMHRNVSPDRIFLEPTTDRVRIAFAAGPIPRIRTREPGADEALAIVRLAVTMLTGQLDIEGQTLAELRPDLPDRLLEETDALLEDPTSDIDVPSYLALIGMADPVAEGETERDRIRAEVLEEQRVERAKLAAERAEFEADRAEERRALAAEGEELRRVFAEEKERLEKEFADAQEALAAERTRLQRMLAEERAALVTKREELERELAARQAVLERAAAADRASIEELRARIRVAGELEIERKRAMALEEIDDAEIRLETGELATPQFVRPYIASLDKIAFRSDDPLARETVRRTPKPPDAARLEEVIEELKAPRRQPIAWRRWLIPAGIAAAVIAATSTVLVARRNVSSAPAPRGRSSVTVEAGMAAPPARARRGATYVPPSAAQRADATRWLDSLRVANPMDMEWALLQSEAVVRRAERARELARERAVFRRDSVARARADSAQRQQQRDGTDSATTRDSGATPGGP